MDHLSSSEAENVSSSDVAGGGSSTSARYKLMSPAKLPISRFSTLSIPPGLSPTSFLESPVLLSNYKLEQSPTTGSFQMMPGTVGSTTLSNTNSSNNNYFDDGKSSCFEFKPCTVLQSGLGLSSPETVFCAGLNHQKSEPSDQVQGQFQPHSFPSPTLNCEATVPHNDLSLSTPMNMVSSGANTPAEVDSNDLNQRGPLALQSDERGLGPPVLAEKSSEDGYNWRKYGQKHVRGSEFPRSYYKCTHPNCEVKKLFERSHDGQITEIIYKGTHDHPKPQSGRRLAAGSAVTTQDERLQVSLFPDRDATDDNPEGAVSQSNAILDEVDDDDDPLTKRRKMDIGSVDVNQDYQVVKPIREPRVVVQTLSEVDILDDGYRWRKYGQKVVRGNPNPRSYYKCTNSGCPVRKHVERAAHDPKAVITTYEGKHNHDVPTARISTHDAAGPISSNGILRVRSEESNKVSLDLGVGINSSGAENGLDEQAPLHGRHSHGQMQLGTSNIKVIGEPSVSTAYYGAFNGGGPDRFESVDPRSHHSFGTLSLSHSSNMYPQSMGRVLLGP